jgi:hypothetical protein
VEIAVEKIFPLILFVLFLFPSPLKAMEDLPGEEKDSHYTKLYFYWTTGRKADDNQNSNAQVFIGGKDYAAAFQSNLEKLLMMSRSNFSVTLICDDLTYNTNDEWLDRLRSKSKGRFTISFVTSILENLIKVFPKQKSILMSIFQNAEGGNPVIVSDFWRLIGMPFVDPGTNTSWPAHQINYVYCDSDIFGYEYPDREEVLVKDVLLSDMSPSEKEKQQGFIIARQQYSSDVIKIKVEDPEEYKKFCGSVLWHQKKNTRLLNYYPTLSSFIHTGSLSKDCLYFVTGQEINHRTVLDLTAPGLLNVLESRYTMQPITYPAIYAFSWYGSQLLENGEFTFRVEDPNKPDQEFVFRSVDNLSRTVDDLIIQDFRKYSKKVALAFYAKRFGEDHPFYLDLVNHLKEKNPFKNPRTMQRVKDKLKAAYESGKDMDEIPAWLHSQLERQKDKEQWPFYLRLQHVLHSLGIDFELTVKELDFTIPSFIFPSPMKSSEKGMDSSITKLHFYWTTGRNVFIGGKDHAAAFRDSLKKLVMNYRNNLSVKLICDNLTYSANKNWLNPLRKKSEGRFNVFRVKNALENLVAVFPEEKSILTSIFRNAEGGNLDFVSDIYSLIGMPFDELHNVNAPWNYMTNHVYCDIGFFACEYPKREVELVKDVLLSKMSQSKSENQQGFMIARRQGANDVIKTKFKNLEKYMEFCRDVLKRQRGNTNLTGPEFLDALESEYIIRAITYPTTCASLIRN